MVDQSKLSQLRPECYNSLRFGNGEPWTPAERNSLLGSETVLVHKVTVFFTDVAHETHPQPLTQDKTFDLRRDLFLL